MQFVVQLALEMISLLSGILSSFTPSTIVSAPSPFAGAESTTLSAPASRCARAFAGSTKRPVHSMTTSIFFSRHGNWLGSASLSTSICCPSTTSPVSSLETFFAYVPYDESCCKRCASVAVSVKSLTATTSTSCLPKAILNAHRPIRPNPFIATRTVLIVVPPPLVALLT